MADDLFETKRVEFVESFVKPKVKSKAVSGKMFKDRTRVLSQEKTRELLKEAFKIGYYTALGKSHLV